MNPKPKSREKEVATRPEKSRSRVGLRAWWRSSCTEKSRLRLKEMRVKLKADSGVAY